MLCTGGVVRINKSRLLINMAMFVTVFYIMYVFFHIIQEIVMCSCKICWEYLMASHLSEIIDKWTSFIMAAKSLAAFISGDAPKSAEKSIQLIQELCGALLLEKNC